MARKVEFEFPESGITVCATLLDEQEPEMCERFWDHIKEPLRMANSHTLSTGCLFDARPRPPRNPIAVGIQAKTLGRVKKLYCDIEPGTVLYSGTEVGFVYGEHITEPMTPSGTIVAKIDDEYLDKMYKAGKFVWDAQFITHLLTTTVARRKEE